CQAPNYPPKPQKIYQTFTFYPSVDPLFFSTEHVFIPLLLRPAQPTRAGLLAELSIDYLSFSIYDSVVIVFMRFVGGTDRWPILP
ncbi:MAG: hypothetical protein ACYSWP_10415, partial [Planctomycetota bacterium]